MKQLFSLCCAALLLLAGCRSQQAAFRFEPAPVIGFAPATQAVSSAANTSVVVQSARSNAAPQLQQPSAKPAPQRHQAPRHGLLHATARPMRLPVAANMASSAATQKHQPLRQPRQAMLEHVAAFVLGAALIAGGVVGGILLGGWLGLGVGALIVLLGYYFVGVGIGGKHAWLEVFQEFFNM